jgi:hypothetical protein
VQGERERRLRFVDVSVSKDAEQVVQVALELCQTVVYWVIDRHSESLPEFVTRTNVPFVVVHRSARPQNSLLGSAPHRGVPIVSPHEIVREVGNYF